MRERTRQNFHWIGRDGLYLRIRRLSISIDSVRLGSINNRKSIRNAHAMLCVSCVNRFGFALPRYPRSSKRIPHDHQAE